MSLPSHVPICRLHHVLAVNPSTAWRRATKGHYGKITRDTLGRQQVEVALVELVEGVTLSDASLASALGKPVRATCGPRITPLTIELENRTFTASEVRSVIDGHLLRRDAQWRRFLARVDELTADILENQSKLETSHE